MHACLLIFVLSLIFFPFATEKYGKHRKAQKRWFWPSKGVRSTRLLVKIHKNNKGMALVITFSLFSKSTTLLSLKNAERNVCQIAKRLLLHSLDHTLIPGLVLTVMYWHLPKYVVYFNQLSSAKLVVILLKFWNQFSSFPILRGLVNVEICLVWDILL